MITLYGELYSSKNSRQVVNMRGRTLVLKSKQCQRGEKEFAPQMEELRDAFISECESQLENRKPLKIAFKIYRKTRRRFDYVNIIQSLLDLMVKHNWIIDDNADEILPVFREYEVDKYNPRVEISIA
jgi:Holliday junction resolvase RusA-like endonuclease